MIENTETYTPFPRYLWPNTKNFNRVDHYIENRDFP